MRLIYMWSRAAIVKISIGLSEKFPAKGPAGQSPAATATSAATAVGAGKT